MSGKNKDFTLRFNTTVYGYDELWCLVVTERKIKHMVHMTFALDVVVYGPIRSSAV